MKTIIRKKQQDPRTIHESLQKGYGISHKLFLRRSLLDCQDASIRRETREVMYNMPELFEEE